MDLLLSPFFSLLPVGFLYILLGITACTVSQVRLVAVLMMGLWADKEIRL